MQDCRNRVGRTQSRSWISAKRGNGKWLVQGRGIGERMMQDIYLLDSDDSFYVIHAMR